MIMPPPWGCWSQSQVKTQMLPPWFLVRDGSAQDFGDLVDMVGSWRQRRSVPDTT